MSELVTAIVTAIGVGGPVAWYFEFRKDRRDDTTSRVDVVVQLSGQVATLQDRVVELFGEVDAAHTATAATRRMVDRLTDRLAVLVPAFRHVLEWLDDGAQGEPPHVTTEVRRLLDDDNEKENHR